MSEDTDEDEWGTVVQGKFGSTHDDGLPKRVTEDEAMAVGENRAVESITLHKTEGSDV